MKILITGATGFIGQHLLEMLDVNSYDISILTRDENKKQRVSLENIKVVRGDLNDLNSLTKATESIDCIVNIAAEVRDQSLLNKTNIQGVKNLMEACGINKVKKIIHISSVGVVGRQYAIKSELVDENCNPTPQNLYEETKLSSEKILLDFAKSQDISTVILRPTNVYGEFHPFNAMLAMVNFIQRKKYILTTRNAKVNFVYVKDLCTVIIESFKDETLNGEIINVGDSEDLDQFASRIARILNVKLRIIYIPTFFIQILEFLKLKTFRPLSNGIAYDSVKFRKIISKFDFDGVSSTINYFKAHNLIK